MVKPQLPVAAQEYTVKGAEAFVRYYIDAQNYASQTGDTSLLLSLSTQSCVVCRGVAKDLKKVFADGGSLVGGLWTVRSVRTVRMTKNRVILTTYIDSTKQVGYDRGRVVVKRYPGLNGAPFNFAASWQAGSWRVSALESGEGLAK